MAHGGRREGARFRKSRRSGSAAVDQARTDRRAIALQRRELHIAAGLELADDGRRGPHPGRDDGLRQRFPLSRRGELARELPALLRLGDEMQELRVAPCAFVHNLREEVLGHLQSVLRLNDVVNAIAPKLIAPPAFRRPSRAPVAQAGLSEIQLAHWRLLRLLDERR